MDKHEKISKLVNHWLEDMDSSALKEFYIDTKTDDLEDWLEEDLDECLNNYKE